MFLFSKKCTGEQLLLIDESTSAPVMKAVVSIAKKVTWGGEVDLVAAYKKKQELQWQQQLNKAAAVEAQVAARNAKLTAKVVEAARAGLSATIHNGPVRMAPRMAH